MAFHPNPQELIGITVMIGEVTVSGKGTTDSYNVRADR
jgi:hypothetical protein